MSKIVRPTVRFKEPQYRVIQERLRERSISFQEYCVELICKDLNVSQVDFDEGIDGQITLSFD